MRTSRAEIQKAYRERKKLNDEQYLQKEREWQRRNYNLLKAYQDERNSKDSSILGKPSSVIAPEKQSKHFKR